MNDLLGRDEIDAFELQIKGASKYYKAALLSELIEKQAKGKSGYFALCFKQARKNFQLNALPIIQELKIPCTLFIQPECAGTNSLPLHEEIGWFKKEYPTKISENQIQEWNLLIQKDQSAAEEALQTIRKEWGVFPIQKIGLDYFYLKWGDLLDLNPEQFEFGLNLSSFSEKWIRESKVYAETQLARKVHTAFSAHKLPFTEDKMRQMGFKGLVTDCVGAVERGKSVFNLPQWRF